MKLRELCFPLRNGKCILLQVSVEQVYFAAEILCEVCIKVMPTVTRQYMCLCLISLLSSFIICYSIFVNGYVPSMWGMFKWNGRIIGEKRVENYFGGIECFLFEILLWNAFGKKGKATSALVTVVVSAKIQSWTSLKQEVIQHFEPVCSISI